MNRKLAVIMLVSMLVCVLSVFGGCAERKSDKPIISISIPPLAGFAKEIVGDNFEIITLVPPGYSPETFEPSPMQMQQYSMSVLTFAVGVPAEQRILAEAKMPIIKLNDFAAEIYGYRYFEENSIDPHIWLSVKRMIVMVQVIGEQIAKFDAENAEFYLENTQNIIQNLILLDQYMSEVLGKIKNKSFVVFHPAFGYLADDYGLTMYALEEEGKEATPAHMQQIIDIAKQANVKAIFYQAENNSKQAQAFAEELGGKTVMLSPLAENYIDNMKKMADTIAEVCDYEG